MIVNNKLVDQYARWPVSVPSKAEIGGCLLL